MAKIRRKEIVDLLNIGHKFCLAFKIVMMRGVRELAC